jgi:hypothetical protein
MAENYPNCKAGHIHNKECPEYIRKPSARDLAIEELVKRCDDIEKVLEIFWPHINAEMSLAAADAGLLFARVDFERALAAYKAVHHG